MAITLIILMVFGKIGELRKSIYQTIISTGIALVKGDIYSTTLDLYKWHVALERNKVLSARKSLKKY